MWGRETRSAGLCPQTAQRNNTASSFPVALLLRILPVAVGSPPRFCLAMQDALASCLAALVLLPLLLLYAARILLS